MSTLILLTQRFLVDTDIRWPYIQCMETLNRKQVHRLIRERQGERSLRAFAIELKVSAAYLSDILLGRREIGPKLLKPLKLRRRKSVTVVYERVK